MKETSRQFHYKHPYEP